jgi:type VI secretion system protein ImpB
VDLKFKSAKSFDPMEVIRQVPELSKLLAARNLVKDLKSNLLDNKDFRKKLEGIMQDKTAMESLMAELDKIVPMDSDAKEGGAA